MAEKQFQIRSLTPKDLNTMYFSFLDAFSNYPIPFRLNKEQFVRKFVEKLKIDFSLSTGAYDYDAMAGFIFSSVNNYNGIFTAYNGGTGVRPFYKGHRLTQQMYDYLIPLFQAKGVKQCILEVLINNTTAIKTYEYIGFQKKEMLNCYKLEGQLNYKLLKLNNLEIKRIYHPNWSLYAPFQDFRASFLDSSEMIDQNLFNEEIIEARVDDELVGFAVYQGVFGRLSQLAVKPERRGNGIGSAIMRFIYSTSRNKELTIINVNSKDTAMIKFLEALNFKNNINQYEMQMQIL